MRPFRRLYMEHLMSKDIALITKDFFTELPFWKDLNQDEKRTIQAETKGLSNILGGVAMLRIEMGERLSKIQKVLEPRRQFKKYLKTLNFSWRTGYRLIAVYEAVAKGLPPVAIRLSAARGMDLAGYNAKNPYGPYQGAVQRLPPPADESLIPDWLDKIEEERKRHPPRRSRRVKAPEDCLRYAYRCAAAGYQCVPAGRGRTAWALRLVGILMGEFGLPGQTVKPEAVPEDFRPKVGRPRKKV